MVEITIPMETAEAEELAVMCEALGMSVEVFLTDTLKGAIAGQKIRYANHQGRMAAIEAQKAGTGVRIIDPATKLPAELGKKG